MKSLFLFLSLLFSFVSSAFFGFYFQLLVFFRFFFSLNVSFTLLESSFFPSSFIFFFFPFHLIHYLSRYFLLFFRFSFFPIWFFLQPLFFYYAFCYFEFVHTFNSFFLINCSVFKHMLFFNHISSSVYFRAKATLS